MLREGFEAKAYKVAGQGNLTIGYGQEGFLFPGTPGAIPVTEGLTIDRALARDALYHFAYNVVDPMVHKWFNPQTQNEHDACASFCYNVRHDRIRTDDYTLPKLIRAADRSEAAVNSIITMWMRYIHTPGAQNGLWKRRLGEVLIFLGLPWDAPAVRGFLESARYFDKSGNPNPSVTPDFLVDIARKAKPIPAEPDPPKAPKPVKAVAAEPLPEIDPTLPPKPMEASKTHKGLSKKESGTEAIWTGAGLTGLAALLPYIDAITVYVAKYSAMTIFTAAGVIGVSMIGVGVWRWWAGRMIAHEGRLEAKQGKV